MTSRKLLKKVGKTVLYISLIVLVLLGSLALFMNSGAGKTFIRNQVQSFLLNRLNTTVEIGAIDYGFPKWLELRDVYMEDLQKDTLLYGQEISVDLNMYKLISGTVDIQQIRLQNIHAHVYRSATDSSFNVQFVVDAFNRDKDASALAENETLSRASTFKRFVLQNVSLKFSDQYLGNSFTSSIGNLDLALNRFQPNKWLFDVNRIMADSIEFNMEMSEPGTKRTAVNEPVSNYLPLIVTVAEASFINVNVAIKDRVSGMEYSNDLQTLSAKKLSVDLLKRFVGVSDAKLDHSTASFIPARIRDTINLGSTKIFWTIAAGKVSMQDNKFSYNTLAMRSGGLDYSHLNTSGINLEAGDFFYSPDSGSASLRHLSFRDEGGFRLDTARADIRFTNREIVAEKLLIKTPGSTIRDNIQLRFADLASVRNQPGLTLVNARFHQSKIAIDDLYDLAPFTTQYLDPAKFRHTSFSLNTEVTGTLEELYFPHLQITGLSGSKINGSGTIYNVAEPSSMSYDIILLNGFVPCTDMARFIPAKNADLLAQFPAGISFGGRVQGDLHAAKTTANFKSDPFDFDGSIAIHNMTALKDWQYDVRIKNSRVKRSILLSFLDSSLIPGNLCLPELVFANGTISGDMEKIKTDLQLRSSYGSLSTNGYITSLTDPENATYELQLNGKDLSVGTLFKEDTLFDKITFKTFLRGRGLNYKTMKGTLEGDVENVDYNQNNYTNIGVTASYNQGHIESSGEINDSSLRLAYELTINTNAAHPGFSASLKLDTVLLKNLYFLDDTMKLSFSGIFRAENLDPYNLNVYASFDSGRVFYKNRTILLDSISATARTIDQKTVVSVRSPFLDADANGHFSYKTIVPAIIQYIDQYYNITDSIKRDTSRQELTFNGVVKNHPMFAKLFPGLKWFDDLKFTGGYASNHGDSALNLAINTPAVQYGTKFLRNIGLSLASRDQQLEYNVGFDTLSLGKSTLFKTSLRGTVANDTIAFIAETLDSRNVPRYNVGGTLYSHKNIFSLTLSDSMLMNYENWKVSANNNISHSRLGLLVSDFVLTKDSASITAGSQQNIPNSPVDIAIENFNIGDLTSALNRDTLLAEGLINARINVSDFNKKSPAITGTAYVNNFKVNQEIVGKLELSGTRQNENTIQGKIALSENNNEVTVNGYYCLDEDEQQFDAKVDLKKLSLASLQGFTNGYMTRASGSLSGLINLTGRLNRPEWKGDLNFDSAKFTVARFGTTYLLNKEKIVFDYPAILFKDFTIRDSLDNPLVVNGNICSRSLTEYDLGLRLNSSDFTLVRAPKAINNLIYGYAGIDANLAMTGTNKAPTIEGAVYVNEKSDLTMVLPEKNIDRDAARSLVRFIDRDTFFLRRTVEFRPLETPPETSGPPINYNLDVKVDKAATLNIVIDPSTGDELKVQGNAHLNAGVNRDGNIILAGDYLLDSGFYMLNYQFLSKRFQLVKGSKMTFAGEPVDAHIDMTAEYIATTSPKELLGNEVGSVDPKLAYSFNQKIPFRVILYLKGSLKKPAISFDIQLPKEGTISKDLRATIDNKLVQLRVDDAATNKQVFALLALDRFVGEQSTDFFKGSGNSGEFNDVARESVSKFLSAALDQLASDLFKGINIDLNLNSYKDFTNSDGTQDDDLNVEVSKNFLNDRLNVTVGKNFGIEGHDGSAKAAQQKGSRFLPDVTVNYKLSQDGKYKLRAYNKNQFEVILDGYIVETGVGFLITMDFDKYQELFLKKKNGEK